MPNKFVIAEVFQKVSQYFMASQPTPKKVPPQKYGFMKGLFPIGFPQYGLLNPYFWGGVR